jgi:hypothetical protein
MIRRRGRVAFLFLGETLLIPHLYPIVDALAEMAPILNIDVWVSTSVHEGLIRKWLDESNLVLPRVRLRRAPGYRAHPELTRGENPPLPAKIPMLLRLLPHLLGASVVVCAEQTSLWLPRLFPFLRERFIKTAHGAGSVSNRGDKRRDAAWRVMLPSAFEAAELVRAGQDPLRMLVTGYVKAGFRYLGNAQDLFPEKRPVIVYSPHWQQKRSSWWAWGREIVAQLAAQDRYNVILAPHQRLVEKDPDIRAVLASVSHFPHVHTDLDSFAMVDGTYMASADIYLGDTSSQVGEFLIRPRPCVFLNNDGIDWRETDDHGFWECGEVIDALSDLPAAIDRATMLHPRFKQAQREFVALSLGDVSPEAARRAAAIVIEAARL